MTRGRFLGASFGIAFLIGASVVLGPAAYGRIEQSWRPAAPARAPVAVQVLAPDVSVAGQIDLADLDGLRARGIRRIVDLRPDGEAADQPSSVAMGEAAARLGLAFAYVPVPHGEMPDAVADSLTAALAGHEGPVLLYCRSGRRAARAWALAESARPGGLPVERIEEQVRAVGQSVDDIAERLRARIAAREPQPNQNGG